jgi:hypothetical protein
MKWLLSLLILSCNDNLLSKHTIEEKYIYPSYYDVWVETDTAIIEVEVYVEDTSEPDPIWVDSFIQPSATAGVDIIWVIDPSGSMNVHKTRVLQGIEDMLNALPQVNWRLAIISADQNVAAQDSDFPLLPGDSVGDAQSMYTSSVVGHYEAGMYAIYNYIENNSFSSNWLREDASLLIVFVSDEEDQSTSQFPVASDFTDWLDGQRDSVYVASIVNFEQAQSQCTTVNPIYVGYRYMDVAQYYNGQVLDICSTDWSAGVIDAANGAVPYTEYPLSEVPADYNYITVFVDGVVYHDAYWDYNPVGNKIEFILGPPGGALVEIAYYYSSGN